MEQLTLLNELQAIARNGLHYATNSYDRERYEKLLALAAGEYALLLDRPVAAIQAAFARELGQITPKVGADAAIFNDQGEILLMDRIDGSGWCLPCGWVEANEQPAAAAVREAREETGLEVVVRGLVGVFTRLPGDGYGPVTMVAVVHLCDIVGGSLELSHEGKALRYWPIAAMTNWHANHELYARAAHKHWTAGKVLPALSA